MPPNPADLLNSWQMDELLSDLEKRFDLVILDCPPVLSIADAPILASKADAILLISYFGKTRKNDMVAAKEALGKVGAHIVGFVLNGVDKSSAYGYGYGYGYYGGSY
jgi:capsular exopolysaccharide synthesis family protein